MILGKESTRHSISHLMLVIFFFYQPKPIKEIQEYIWAVSFLQNIFSSTYDYYSGENFWEKIADILQRKWPKKKKKLDEDKFHLYD